MNAEPTPTTAPPSRRGLFLLALGLLAAGLAVALVALLYRPGYVVLVDMNEAEADWFRARVDAFAEQHRVKLTVVAFASPDELGRQLEGERLARQKRILLVQAPQEMLVPLVDEGLMLPLTDLGGKGRIREISARFLPEAVSAGQPGGNPYYLPATVTTTLLFYSKKRVAEAVEGWESVRPTVDGWLREANGNGLPRNYVLEADPMLWDSYDVAVVAAFWATREFEGLRTPRLAHSAARNAGTAMDLASRVFAFGGSNEQLLSLDGHGLWDAFAWESFFFEHGLYHPSMRRESWDANDLLAAIAQGQIYLCTLTEPDVYRLHGTGAPGMEGFLKEPGDLGVARLPRGLSLAQDQKQGSRTGGSFSARSGTWWGVPRTAPDAPLALALAEHVTSPELQTDWCRAFGYLPPLRDLVADLDVVFREDWAFQIARTAKSQALELGRALPSSPRWRRAQPVLIAAWDEACAERHLTEPLDLVSVLERHAGTIESVAGTPPPATSPAATGR
ncbi:MAG: extracellular solute-binding protein [Candidatus Eiseniibacteriota bacterium]